uniref:Uncharacterized protein n=1 Tax=Amorphochlora amoebiformis TaxID=1561963 RepID=A0A7S0DLR9_9EUKA|mmetsp:Transcript_33728/g.54311  ORF Transcript_33728/g.54311 Transcript_33728/m.54311 type:complete len:166 (+) Transcript_33728:85-582(+)
MSDDDLKHRLQQNEWGANPSPDFEETSPTPSSLSSRKRASDSTMSNIPDLTTKKSKGNGSVRARKRRKGSVCKSRAQRQVEAKQKRAQGLYTTVHGSQICGYVCLSEGNKKRYGRPCSQFATSGSQYCKSHAKFGMTFFLTSNLPLFHSHSVFCFLSTRGTFYQF